MLPRVSVLSSSTNDLWSVVSLDELSDDLLNDTGVNDDNDDDMVMADSQWRSEDLPPEPAITTTSTTTTTTSSKTKLLKTRPTKSVVRRNERERNRVKKVKYKSPRGIQNFLYVMSPF